MRFGGISRLSQVRNVCPSAWPEERIAGATSGPTAEAFKPSDLPVIGPAAEAFKASNVALAALHSCGF